MRLRIYFVSLGLALAFAGCGKPEPVLAPPPAAAEVAPTYPDTESGIWIAPSASPTPVNPEPEKPAIVLPPPPTLTQAGIDLIYEFETGSKAGYDPHPELPDLRFSGITVGIGWDLHQYSKAVILSDWSVLPAPIPTRLAKVQPYYGRSAVEPLKTVRDILISWELATGVFEKNDIAREFSSAKRAYGPEFVELSLNCQAALISNGFQRGYGFSGPNRAELRAIRDLVPKRDVRAIAYQLRKSIRVWVGSSIENGLRRRKNAEARLAETPDPL
jgi:GH24 family phage-related lysozyme (muramidase)